MSIKCFRLFAVCMMIEACLCSCAGNADKKDIRLAVERQMELFPYSTLHDLYKNFFQDQFGPGHLVADTASAGRYLRSELPSWEESVGPDYTSTGYKSRFYRVNLSVIGDGRIPYQKYFDAFIRSVKQLEEPDIDSWRKEWKQIDSVIQSIGLKLPGEDLDRQSINEMLERGEYVIHHSDLYGTHYLPHYRLIEKSIFEAELLPFL